MLNYVVHGQPQDTKPLLIAHGLFGSARNWGVLAKRLSDARQVIAVDMRNHADSPWMPSHTYFDMAGDLSEVIDQFGPSADVLGHSMGGKAAMALALSEPDKVGRLIVADIAPVAYDHTQLHLIRAMQAVDFSVVETRSDVEAQLSSIEPPELRAFLLQSVDIKNKKWKLNLDVLAQYIDDILGFPHFDTSFDGPTLFLTGANSTYVTQQHRPEIKRLFPAARFAKIPGAGHWLHAEKPREFEAAVRAFLQGQ